MASAFQTVRRLRLQHVLRDRISERGSAAGQAMCVLCSLYVLSSLQSYKTYEEEEEQCRFTKEI